MSEFFKYKYHFYIQGVGTIDEHIGKHEQASLLVSEERLFPQLQDTKTAEDSLTEILQRENQELMNLLDQNIWKETSFCADESLSPSKTLTALGNHLLDLQNKTVLSAETGVTSDLIVDPSQEELELLMWMGRERQYPVQYDVLNVRESEIKDICTPSLSTTFSHFDESQKHFYMQKVASKVEELQQLSLDAKNTGSVTKIIYHYVLMIEYIQHWIEFLETWILRISQLPAEQHHAECKLIEEQLTSLQQYLITITSYNQEISGMLPTDIRNKITEKFAQLQTRMDSTTKFAATSFTQVSGWVKKSEKIKEELKIINDALLSQEKELDTLQNEKIYDVPDIESLNSQIVGNCYKSELLCLNQQKFSLNWIGYQAEDNEQLLRWCRILKLKVSRATANTKNMRDKIETYQLSYELLNQFLLLIENIFSCKPCIEDLNDSRKQKEFLESLMQSLMTILWTVKENYQLSLSSAQISGMDEKYQRIVEKAADVMKKGQKKLEDWNLWELQIINLEELIENSSCWLKEKNQIFVKNASDDKNLQHSYDTFKDLQWSISSFRHDIDLIKKLKTTISSHTEIPSLEKSSTEIIDQFKELQHNVDSELNKVIFSKEWTNVKNEIDDFQHSVSSTNKQISRMQKKINHMGSDDSVLKFLQDISNIETEILYRENVSIWIRDHASLPNCSSEEFKKLENAVSQYNQIIKSCLNLKKTSLQKIAHSEKGKIEEKMKLWVKDVEENFNNISSNSTMNPKEMKSIKHKLISCMKILDIVIDYLSADKQQIPIEKVTDDGQIFDRNRIELLKMKLKFELEKYETLILQYDEYLRFTSEMNFTIERINDFLNGIKNRVWQMNHFEVAKSKRKLMEFHKLLGGHKVYQEFTCLDVKITGSENLPNTLAEASVAESSISPIINEMNEYLQLWDHFEKAETSIRSFLSQKKHFLSICCLKIVSIEHLHDSIKTLQTLLDDIKANEELMEHYKITGSEFETRLIGDSQSYIQNKVQSSAKEWVDFQQTATKLLENQSSLLKEWREFDSSFQSLSASLSSSWHEVMHSHHSRSHSYNELENIMEEFNQNRNHLVSLTEIGRIIQSSSLLHSSVKESIKNKIHSLNSSVRSFEEASKYSNQKLLNSVQEETNDKKALQSAELFIGSIENDFKMDIPLSKQELETMLATTEMSLCEAAFHYSAVECIRRRLLFDDTINFETAMNISRILISLQQATSRLTAYYLNLRKTISECNSFVENIICILRFLKSFKQIFSEMPSDYSELLKFFANFQLMDIYIHSYQPILHSVVQEGLRRSKAMDPSHSELVVACFKGIQHEWECLESIYESKLTEIKKAISLWETYLHCVSDVKMWIHKAKKELKQHPRVLKLTEIEEKISLVQELINEEEMFSSMIEKAKEVAEELGVIVSSVAKNNLLGEILNLQETSQQQANSLERVLKELKEAHFSFKKFECELVTVKDGMAAISTSMIKLTSTHAEAGKNKLQEIQAELHKIKGIILKLNELESQLKKLGENIFCCDYYMQIATQKDIAEALGILCEQYAAKYDLISEASEENQKFLEMYKILLKWNELTENKLGWNYHESPESVEEKLQLYIKNEAEENSNLLQQMIVIGQSLEENKEKSEFISSAISSCSTNVSRTISLIDSRNQKLQNILTLKKRAVLLQENTEEFLTNTEQFLYTPLQFTDVSLKDVDGLIQVMETLQNEVHFQNQSIEALTKDTDELVSQTDAFSSTTDKCLFQHSTQKILSKWALLKALASERYSYLTNVKTSWKDILTLLNGLEEWLDSKEKIASEVDYIEKDHPRSVYLEGIKIFESLKHSFQDDINLLHNVNAVYHKTAKQDLDVNGCLKNRVLVLNDRWRILYQKVCDILTAISNILQLWADYDQLHEHLHLFLTETHIRITELEHSNNFNRSECDTIMNDFAHHEDALERYKALANNLQQKSQCSAVEINHQVEEIEKYWAEVYGCLRNYGDSILKNIKIEEEVLLQQASSSSFTAEFQNVLPKDEKYQTVDDDGITSSADNFETDSIIATSNKDSDEVTSSSFQKEVTESKKLTVTRKSSETGDDEAEFIKDLLAALEEAEDRIDSLETVLSEPTPCGTNDSTAPNYSRLLAACRSSIDVIQHLNQLVCERSSDKSSKLSETDIQHRTEGMLVRWEKIEAATLSKEFRALENAKKWKQFSEELQDIEKWLLDALDSQTSQSIADADFEKFIVFLQRHEELISQISEQKKAIISLNITGQKFISSSAAKENLAAVDEKLKAVNNHWEQLCSVALEWQNRLQTEFLQSSEFCSTISEMELWLEDSKEKIQSLDLSDECKTSILHKQHTEIYALKQQLENCSQRIKTLLNISGHLFQDKEEFSVLNEGMIEMQSRLHSIMTLSQCLLLECTDILTSLSALLTGRMALQERPCNLTSTYSNEDENPNRISRCCGFLLRVARASLPIQAILLLLLGAAILLPKEDEELSCRFSNNFASSLNPMLHYPDGPPPV